MKSANFFAALKKDPADVAGWYALADALEEEGNPEAPLVRVRAQAWAWALAQPAASLCYVQGRSGAHFTTQKLSEQWGDDWDNAPYGLNAETPYTDPNWRIIRVYLVNPAECFGMPGELTTGEYREFSVEQVNRGEVPWLTVRHPESTSVFPHLYAGTTVVDFCATMDRAGVYWFPIPDLE